jgi:hypothetical protein
MWCWKSWISTCKNASDKTAATGSAEVEKQCFGLVFGKIQVDFILYATQTPYGLKQWFLNLDSYC